MDEQPRYPELERAIGEVRREYQRARRKHPPLNSAHEGYAVLLEEFDELTDALEEARRGIGVELPPFTRLEASVARLWELVKEGSPDYVEMRHEAVQVAAMAVAFILEVCDPEVDG